MENDAELLRRYADEKSEAAFADLVRRHLDLVYSAALRRLGGDAHAAADVAQQVFATLARDAGKLSRHGVLTAWLYTATRNAAIDHIRSEQRRHAREQEALTMQTLSAATPGADWEKLRPVLDEVMDELSDADRTAVLLRFFEKRAFAEVGAALHLSEDAARMRVERALDKLRVLLARREITSTTAALATALANQIVTAAPTGLAAAISAMATAGVPAGAVGVASATALAAFSGVKIAAVLTSAAVLGLAVYEFRWGRSSAESIAAIRTENRIETGRLAELSRRADLLMGEVAALQRAVSAARTAPAAPGGRGGGGGGGGSPATDGPEALAAGEEFLAKHPEAQQVLTAIRRERFDNSWGPRLAGLQLSPAEYDQIFAEWVRQWPWVFRVNPPAWAFGSAGSYSDGQLNQFIRELVGDARFQRFDQSLGFLPADQWVRALAGALHDTDAPLTAEQAAAFAQALSQSVGRGRPWPLPSNSPIWTAARPALVQVLTANQLAALDTLRESGAVRPRF
jgi:RNA polymerase sigma factor (sigma-70 family)